MFLTNTVKQSQFSITESMSDLYEFIIESQESIADSKFEIIQLEHESLLKKEQGYLSESEFLEAEEEVKEKGKGFLGKIVEFIRGLITRAVNFFKGLYNKIVGKIDKNADYQVKEGFFDKLTKGAMAVKEFCKEVWANPNDEKAFSALKLAVAGVAAAGAYQATVKGMGVIEKMKICLEAQHEIESGLKKAETEAASAESSGDAEKANKARGVAAALSKGISMVGGLFTKITTGVRRITKAVGDTKNIDDEKVAASKERAKNDKESDQTDMFK